MSAYAIKPGDLVRIEWPAAGVWRVVDLRHTGDRDCWHLRPADDLARAYYGGDSCERYPEHVHASCDLRLRRARELDTARKAGS